VGGNDVAFKVSYPTCCGSWLQRLSASKNQLHLGSFKLCVSFFLDACCKCKRNTWDFFNPTTPGNVVFQFVFSVSCLWILWLLDGSERGGSQSFFLFCCVARSGEVKQPCCGDWTIAVQDAKGQPAFTPYWKQCACNTPCSPFAFVQVRCFWPVACAWVSRVRICVSASR
jgi:hypothetical protein